MSLTVTSLSAACGASDLVLNFNTPTAGSLPAVGSVVNWPLRVDTEVCFLVQMLSSTQGKVRMRGAESTFAVAHDVNATVLTSASGTDFPSPASSYQADSTPYVDNTLTVGQDSTITIPTVSTTYNIEKGSICNITIPQPLATQQGLVLTFIGVTNYAHVITAAGGLGGATSKVTFVTGSSTPTVVFEVNAAGNWVVVGTNNATVS